MFFNGFMLFKNWFLLQFISGHSKSKKQVDTKSDNDDARHDEVKLSVNSHRAKYEI